MNIMISGKHVDIGESLNAHIGHRLEEGISKYLDRVTSVGVVVTKEAHRFRVDINGNTGTSSGIVIKSSATADDVYACFDAAADKIEKQLRRYKRRITNHHKHVHHGDDGKVMVTGRKYVLKSDDEKDAPEDSPVVIAEKVTAIEHLSVSAAVMKMELADLPALMFFNSASGRINVIYRRIDGNISWVDPEDKAA
jgi:ribosomal subunit interface protein